jgi:hypothetical protein
VDFPTYQKVLKNLLINILREENNEIGVHVSRLLDLVPKEIIQFKQVRFLNATKTFPDRKKCNFSGCGRPGSIISNILFAGGVGKNGAQISPKQNV